MRWSWPSWVAIVLGVVCLFFGLYHSANSTTPMGNNMMVNNMNAGWGTLFLSGAILLAAGLHSLQASYDSWCDCGYGDGCGCNHCKECSDGACCGHCGCEGMQGGHEGHDHK